MELSLKITLLAMVAQIVLTIWAISRTGVARLAVLKSKELHIRDIALSTDAYPTHVKQLQNNMRNQFETPPMFYAAVVLVAALDLSNWGIACAAVTYVLLRFWHRYVHVGNNNVILRFKVFLASLFSLSAIWLLIAAEILLS